MDTVDFYRGAAVLLLLRAPGCKGLQATQEGFLVNGAVYFELKHCTSGKSRWTFNVSTRDLERMVHYSQETHRVFLGLVCGGDGVCTLPLGDILSVAGPQGGWVATARPYGRSYAVVGRAGHLARKVPRSDWPRLLLEEKNGGCVDE
ncbi:hypothetical protein [Candidatus Cryosericum odellii]|jgi:hypothetical protein|uniref:hypothetical protein n=1 Tax=Candidatus Cryosericum odellii TaxID=2290917 RepID=UPI000F88BA80|nr:hypothetical protein [Candidatus Cryosericum odellii]